MAKRLWILLSVVAFFGAFGAVAVFADAGSTKEPPGPEKVAELRTRGPEGLVEALRMYDVIQLEERQRMFSCFVQPTSTPNDASKLAAWDAAIDQIGGQRSCTVSRLYWYTDLAEAKAEAERTGRPILSLRMLGKLTDEFSCANSRFFRTALYSNKEISDYLRDNFVLHWRSVRPVPRVTIDFGDGRTLKRTLTGNSAHYVLASDGAPLDVLPGLYSPQAFLKWLQTTHDLDASYRHIAQSRPAPGPRWAQVLKQYHRAHRDQILQAWDQDLARLDDKRLNLVSSRINNAMAAETESRASQQQASPPKANAAANRAVTKSFVERPLLRFAGFGGQVLEKGMDDDLWQSIAALHRDEVHLDESSTALMRREFPNAADAGALSGTKRQVEDPMLRVIQTFENSMSLDTVRNEYLLHRRIHERLAESKTGTMDLDTLNEWVYASLFLTPSKDPWLGLAPSNVYTALEGDGREEPAKQIARRPGQ